MGPNIQPRLLHKNNKRHLFVIIQTKHNKIINIIIAIVKTPIICNSEHLQQTQIILSWTRQCEYQSFVDWIQLTKEQIGVIMLEVEVEFGEIESGFVDEEEHVEASIDDEANSLWYV